MYRCVCIRQVPLYMISIILFINSKNISSSSYVMFHQILLLRQNSQDIPIYLLNYTEYYSVIQPEKLPPPTHPPTFNVVSVVVSTSVVQGYHKCPYPVKK